VDELASAFELVVDEAAASACERSLQESCCAHEVRGNIANAFGLRLHQDNDCEVCKSEDGPSWRKHRSRGGHTWRVKRTNCKRVNDE